MAIQSYFYGWIFWTMVTLGCILWTLIIHTVKATWGYPILRLFEAGSRLLPVMVALGIPILFFLPDLYPWAKGADAIARDPILLHRASYMTPFWFAARSILYFVVWGFFSRFVNNSTQRQDKTGDLAETQLRSNVSAPGIAIFIIVLTFAVTDWVMSLDPHWYSTIYGFIFADGILLSSMSLIALVSCLQARRDPYSGVMTKDQTRDMGNLMLTFTMVWAYFALSQWLIIWSGNLPEEIVYYHARLTGWLLWCGTGIVVLQFFAPFILLLSSRAKRTPILLALIASLILAVRIVDIFWIVVPMWRKDLIVSDIGAILAFGGVWLTVFALNALRTSLFPLYALRRKETGSHA